MVGGCSVHCRMFHSLYPLVQFSRSVVSNSLQPHGLQHTGLPCPSPTPGACSNSCPLSWWCYPTISSSAVPFSSHLQSFQHQGLFKWVSSSHQVAKVLEFHLQHQSFQYIKYYACVYVEELGKTLLSCAVKHMDRPLNINWSHSGKNKTIFFFLI